MTNRSALRAAMIVTAVAVLSAGCAGDGSPGRSAVSSVNVSAGVTWSNVWSADPGIDVFSREAELVRASVEGGYLALARGDDRTFPGYAEAIGPQQFAYGDPRRAAKNFGYSLGGPGPHVPDFSALYFHIVELNSRSTRVEAQVCWYGLKSYPSDAGRYLIESVFVTLEKPVAAPSGLPGIRDTITNQRETVGRAPIWNVFSPWSITRLHTAEADEVPSRCANWWKSVFPDAVKSDTSNQMVRSSGGPVAINVAQFPRWIGPSRIE